jgi:hypothetical protein
VPRTSKRGSLYQTQGSPHLLAGTALGELCAMAGLESVESLLRYARHVDGAPQSKAALRAAART